MFHIDGDERLKLFRLVECIFHILRQIHICKYIYLATSNATAYRIKNLFEIINLPKWSECTHIIIMRIYMEGLYEILSSMYDYRIVYMHYYSRNYILTLHMVTM